VLRPWGHLGLQAKRDLASHLGHGKRVGEHSLAEGPGLVAIEDQGPKALGTTVAQKMCGIYHLDDALRADSELDELARQLTCSHPGVARSLREDLYGTLTVMCVKVPPTLLRTLRSTNAIESMIEMCRDHSSNVKRWRDGQMALRWCAAGMAEAAKQFRKVNGLMHLPALRKALNAYTERCVAPVDYNEEDAA